MFQYALFFSRPCFFFEFGVGKRPSFYLLKARFGRGRVPPGIRHTKRTSSSLPSSPETTGSLLGGADSSRFSLSDILICGGFGWGITEVGTIVGRYRCGSRRKDKGRCHGR